MHTRLELPRAEKQFVIRTYWVGQFEVSTRGAKHSTTPRTGRAVTVSDKHGCAEPSLEVLFRRLSPRYFFEGSEVSWGYILRSATDERVNKPPSYITRNTFIRDQLRIWTESRTRTLPGAPMAQELVQSC